MDIKRDMERGFQHNHNCSFSALQGEAISLNGVPKAKRVYYSSQRYPDQGYSDCVAMIKCGHCERTGIPGDASFCPYCGFRFLEEECLTS